MPGQARVQHYISLVARDIIRALAGVEIFRVLIGIIHGQIPAFADIELAFGLDALRPNIAAVLEHVLRFMRRQINAVLNRIAKGGQSPA